MYVLSSIVINLLKVMQLALSKYERGNEEKNMNHCDF